MCQPYSSRAGCCTAPRDAPRPAPPLPSPPQCGRPPRLRVHGAGLRGSRLAAAALTGAAWRLPLPIAARQLCERAAALRPVRRAARALAQLAAQLRRPAVVAGPLPFAPGAAAPPAGGAPAPWPGGAVPQPGGSNAPLLGAVTTEQDALRGPSEAAAANERKKERKKATGATAAATLERTGPQAAAGWPGVGAAGQAAGAVVGEQGSPVPGGYGGA
jgi:hypothetical protein